MLKKIIIIISTILLLLIISFFSRVLFVKYGNSDEIKIISPYSYYSPLNFSDGLKLVNVSRLPSWTTSHPLIFTYLDGKEEIKNVSVDDGYTLMYSYPNTEYFANVKVEKSIEGQYEKDKQKVIEFTKLNYQRKTKIVENAILKDPNEKISLDKEKAKNVDYFTYEENTYKGYDYVYFTENIIGLTENIIGLVYIFIPEEEIIITAYLLNQKNTHFKNIDEFLLLRDKFITGYIDFIESNNK
ncbi:MAG: hypothetical protein GY828_07470 [Candidatus Gracilibacteria bacterium]|nr:hypothetical protein [Candidatus Gracilibacteria bacterium]